AGREARPGGGADEQEKEVPAGPTGRAGDVGQQHGRHAQQRVRQAVSGEALAAAAGDDRIPDVRVADHDVTVVHEAARDLVAGLAVDDVDAARPGQGQHGEGGDEQPGEG